VSDNAINRWDALAYCDKAKPLTIMSPNYVRLGSCQRKKIADKFPGKYLKKDVELHSLLPIHCWCQNWMKLLLVLNKLTPQIHFAQNLNEFAKLANELVWEPIWPSSLRPVHVGASLIFWSQMSYRPEVLLLPEYSEQQLQRNDVELTYDSCCKLQQQQSMAVNS